MRDGPRDPVEYQPGLLSSSRVCNDEESRTIGRRCEEYGTGIEGNPFDDAFSRDIPDIEFVLFRKGNDEKVSANQGCHRTRTVVEFP